MARRPKQPKQITALTHGEASRKNIPTAEHQAVMAEGERKPVPVTYQRRNRDLDPQLMWRGKDEQDWQDLVAPAPPLFIQEKVHPKVLIDDLLRRSKEDRAEAEVQVEPVRGFQRAAGRKHPYRVLPARRQLGEPHDPRRQPASDGIACRTRRLAPARCSASTSIRPTASSSTPTSSGPRAARDVKDGKTEHMTREPEQVKAFRDTWRDGIHSYLTYLRDRLTVVRDLLTESGSVFVQIV